MKKKDYNCAIFRKKALLAFLLLLAMTFSGCGLAEELVAEFVMNQIERGKAEEPAEAEKEEFWKPEIKDPDPVPSISGGNYAYECLNEEEKQVYDQMLDTILNFTEETRLATTGQDVMKKSYQALCCDYGSLFWVDGYSYTSYTLGDEVMGIGFSPAYTMEREEKDRLQARVDRVVDQWLGGISTQDTDYDKAKYVFDVLIENVDYVEGAPENQNILSVFLYRETVCQGYANAVQYLLKQLGIPCMIVTGYAHNEPHAWDVVQLDGHWYHMDATWGNSTYLDTEQQEAKYVNYNYMCMTDEENALTHRTQMEIDIPECNSMEHNYYVHQGLYFDSFMPEEMGWIFQNAWENGEQEVAIKCETEEIYDQMKEYFIEEQKIADYCWGLEYVYYMEDRQLHVLSINFY